MNSRPAALAPLPLVRSGAALLALALGLSAPLSAFDRPNFAARLFDADGVFLPEDERSSLLEALAALAANFEDHTRVDDDVREKALALALQLDPLHHSSRLALRQLSAGEATTRTSFFESLASVSESLWTVGSHLAERPADPEARRLAPFLLELALVVHPEPPEERLVALAKVGDGKPPAWDPAVRLEPDQRSTARAVALHREARDLAREQGRSPAPAVATTNAAAPMATPSDEPPPPAPPAPPVRPGREIFEPIVASLAMLQWVEGVESALVAGTVSLTLRPPRNSQERERFAQEAEETLLLVASSDDVTVSEPILPSALLEARSWKWPAPGLGEVRFAPAAELPGPRRLLRTQAALPSAVLVESIVSGRAVNDTFALAGDLQPDTLAFAMPGDLPGAITSAPRTGKPYLLVPSTLLEPLVAFLQRTDRIELLFGTELVACADLDSVVRRLLSPPDPALAAASTIFREVEAASSRLPLPELARNPAAQERLRALLDAFPDHLSARAMLEYGTRPLSPELKLLQFAERVGTLVEPFVVLAESEFEFEPELAQLIDRLDPAKLQFVKLRGEVPLEVRSLLTSAENLVEASAAYLQLSNRGTSTAAQRLRDARAAIAAYETEREKFSDPARP